MYGAPVDGAVEECDFVFGAGSEVLREWGELFSEPGGRSFFHGILDGDE